MVNAFWSVMLHSVPDYRVAENQMKRYNPSSNPH
jgi:predicted metal-dependent hydrolase